METSDYLHANSVIAIQTLVFSVVYNCCDLFVYVSVSIWRLVSMLNTRHKTTRTKRFANPALTCLHATSQYLRASCMPNGTSIFHFVAGTAGALPSDSSVVSSGQMRIACGEAWATNAYKHRAAMYHG